MILRSLIFRLCFILILISSASSRGQFINLTYPATDFCTHFPQVTYTVSSPVAGHTYSWSIDDFSNWEFSGNAINSGPFASGPSVTLTAGTAGQFEFVRVQEFDANQVMVAEAMAAQVNSNGISRMPVYRDYQQCAFIAVPTPLEPFYAVPFNQRWAMWYKNGVPTGWNYPHYDYPFAGTGTYQYKTKLVCGDTVVSDTIAVTVIAATISASGPTTFCNGDSVTLSAVPGSYSIWNWMSGSGPVPNSSNKSSITVKTSGNYSIQFYINSGSGQCFQMSDPVTVTVNPGAVITSASVGCTGDSVQLSCNTANSYLWKRNGAAIAGGTTQSIWVKQSGSYTVTTTGLVCNTSTPKQVTFYPKATLSVTPSGTVSLCSGETTTLTASGNNITSYQWLRNNIALTGSDISAITVTKSGSYKCIVSNVVGCTKSTAAVQVSNAPVTPLPSATLVLQPDASGTDSYNTCEFGHFTTNYGSYPYMDVSNWYKHFRTADRGVIRFDLNEIPAGSPVTSATIRLYADTFAQSGTGVQHLLLKRFTQSWQENSISWSNEPDSSDFQFTSVPTSSITSHAAFTASVTDLVKHWVAKPAENYGMLMILDEMVAPYVWMRLGSGDNPSVNKRPKLTVNYSYAKIDTSGRLNLCTGGSVTFTTNAGYSTKWYKNNVLIPGATGVTYTANSAGSYFVVLTNASGCTVRSVTRTVTLNAAPSANIYPPGPVTICANSSTTLTADSMPGYTYQWKRNGTNIAGATKRNYAATLAGTYSVVINTLCGTTATGSVVCNVVTNPAATITAGGPTTFCAGQSVLFTANTYSGVTWQWRKNGADIPNAIAQIYNANAAGTYTVRETANGCTKTSGSKTVVINCRLARETDVVELSIVPQPFNESASIVLPAGLDTDEITFEINDLNGRLIRRFQCDGGVTNLNRNQLKAGMYFLTAYTSKDKIAVSRFVVID